MGKGAASEHSSQGRLALQVKKQPLPQCHIRDVHTRTATVMERKRTKHHERNQMSKCQTTHRDELAAMIFPVKGFPSL